MGCTSFCNISKSDKIEIVANAVQPSMEKIASLKPDLVFASGLTTERDVETLRKLGIKVERLQYPKSFEDICSEFLKIGQFVGKEALAKQIIEESKTKAAAIKSNYSDKNPKYKVFIEMGTSPIYTALPGTYMDDYITYSGGANIASGMTSGNVGRELIVSRNPDFIFIATMGIAAEEEKKKWGEFTRMNAVKHKNIYVIDSDLACQPNPVSFVQMLEILTGYMYK